MNKTTTTTQKGWIRGIVYPLVALAFHGMLVALIHTGWLSDSGAIALTGLVGWVDHKVI